MDSKLKIHLCWTIGVLTSVIIILVSVYWNGVKDLAGILNFALGLTSLVLAVVAIVYGFIANNSFAGTVAKIESAASAINDVVRAIPEKLSSIEKTTQDMHKTIASSQGKPPSPPSPQENKEILAFVNIVIEEFLRTSSWNGLKLMQTCRRCCEKKLELDLKAFCSVDDSMSYDYAYGYIVASASAHFLQFATQDHVKLHITFMPTAVAERIDAAIKARLDVVGIPTKTDFQLQLDRVTEFFSKLEGGGNLNTQ
jgi:hypothetical protein